MNEMPVKLRVNDSRKEKIFIRHPFNTNISESGGNYGFHHYELPSSSREIVEQALIQAMQDYGCVLSEDAPITIDVTLRKFLYFENNQKEGHIFTADIQLDVIVKKSNQLFAKKRISTKIDKKFDLFRFHEQPESTLSLCLSNVVENVASDLEITNGIKRAYGKRIVAKTPPEISPPKLEIKKPKGNGKTPKVKKAPEQPVISQGTGFLFAKSGLVATNYHVVSEREDLRVFFPETNVSFVANVELKDISNDLVILRLTNFVYEEIFSEEIPYAIKRSNTVQLGEKVFTLGFPLGKLLGSSAKFSDGTVSSLSGLLGTANLFQINNPIQPGNSGGPLFDKHGNVVGIVLASLDAKFFYEKLDTIPQNVNFAIKSDYLISLISMLPEKDSILSRKGSLQDKTQEEQVNALIPYIITVYVR
jgi:S1-C subfamily serine protease